MKVMDLMLPSNGTVKVKWPPGSNPGLNFLSGIRYSFADDQWNLLHYGVTCRDVMLGIAWCEVLNTSGVFYSTSYKPTGKLFSKDGYTRIVFKPKNGWEEIDLNKYIQNLQKFFDIYDKILGFKPTFIFSGYDDTNTKTILVRFDEKWVKTPYLLSFFLLVLRNGHNIVVPNKLDLIIPNIFKHNETIFSSENSDSIYLRDSWLIIYLLLEHGYIFEQTYEQYSQQSIKNLAGFYNYYLLNQETIKNTHEKIKKRLQTKDTKQTSFTPDIKRIITSSSLQISNPPWEYNRIRRYNC